MNIIEKWEDIKGYEKLYRISSMGRVLSKKRKGVVKDKYLTPCIGSNGYYTVSLTKNKKLKTYTVHRLVATHFLEMSDVKKEVNHVDGFKANNMVSNLEFVTNSENKKHAYRLGLYDRRGESHHKAILTNNSVIHIRELSEFMTNPQIATLTGLKRQHIEKIVNRSIWKHI